jgi:hypothetical protein
MIIKKVRLSEVKVAEKMERCRRSIASAPNGQNSLTKDPGMAEAVASILR